MATDMDGQYMVINRATDKEISAIINISVKMIDSQVVITVKKIG